MSQHMEIARTIADQINHLSPMAFGSWGAKNFVATLPQTQGRICDQTEGGLQFKVNGIKHKGLVKIELQFNDTYRIRTVKIRKQQVVICEEREDVFFDELIEHLDEMIEDRHYNW